MPLAKFNLWALDGAEIVRKEAGLDLYHEVQPLRPVLLRQHCPACLVDNPSCRVELRRFLHPLNYEALDVPLLIGVILYIRRSKSPKPLPRCCERRSRRIVCKRVDSEIDDEQRT